MDKTYVAPRVEYWEMEHFPPLNLLASLSIAGDVADFEAGDPNDITEDEWD